MTQEKKVQTAVVMDVSQAEQSAQGLVRTVGKAAADIAKEGEKAGKGLGKIGDGAEDADRRVDAATKSLSDRIRRRTRDVQRELAALASSSDGGAGSASALEYEAVARGANLQRLQPQIAAFRELKTQVDSVGESMRQAMAGNDLLVAINTRTDALQRQANSAKMAEADMLALRAAELGVTQQAGPLIAKLRESAAAADEAAKATRRNAEANNFLSGLTNQAGAIGKTRADLLEMQAAQLGVTEKAAPMIAAIRKADGQMMGMGKSAKETQWALRGLPAQFTDIWVSLASGQNPMIVFMQQGGQIKDMFGGIGPAARAMGGYIMGLVNPFTLAAAGAGVLFAAFQAGANEIAKLNQAVILSGEKLGVTANQLQDVAASVAAMGKGTQGAASEFLGMIAKDALVAAGSLERFTIAALEMQRAGGPAAKETAAAFTELGKEPVAASLKLTQQFNYLTAATYEQIKALADAGKSTDAAALAQQAYAAFLEERAPRMAASLGLIERGWYGVKSAAADAWNFLKSIGRDDTLQQQSQAIAAQRAALVAGLQDYRGPSDRRAQVEEEIKRLDQRQASLQETLRLEGKSAELGAQRLAVTEATARLLKREEETAGNTAKAKKEIAEFERDALLTGKNRQYIEEGIAKIREKYADKTPRGRTASAGDPFAADRAAAKEWAEAYARFSDLAAEAEGRVGQLTKTQVELAKFLQSPAYQNMGEPARQLALNQAYAAINAEQLSAAQKEQAKVSAEAAREYGKWVDELNRGTKAAEDQAQKLRDEAEATKLVIPGYRSLETALIMVDIARLRERQTAMMGNEDAVLAIEREINARRKLVEVMGQRDMRKAAEEQAKRTAEEWQRTAESINSSLTDALLRGFESGKDFARNFRDTLSNMFRTLVLRPIVQAIVQPVSVAMAGGMGVSSQASAATNIVAQAGQGGVAESLGKLYSTLSNSFDAVGNTVAMAADKIGEWLVMNTSGALNKAGGTLMEYAGQLGGLSETVAGAAAGMALRRAIGGKFEIDKGFSAFQDVGVAVASAIGGPVMGAIAGAVAGVVNRAFGRTPKQTYEQGITGEFTGGDASAESYNLWIKKGGWFRSDKRGDQREPLQEDVSAALDAGALAVLEQTKAWATALQLPAEQLAGITSTFKIKFTEDDEANKAAITEAIQSYGVLLAENFADTLRPLQRWGENLSDTLGRVSTLQTFSQNLNELGGVFSRVANLGIDAKESFIAMAGGMEALMQNALGFAQNYYSREEIAGLKASEIERTLTGIGIADAGSITSRDDFRALVEATDVSTESGREQLATLLRISGAFVDVADYIAEVGGNLGQVSAQAPDGVITDLINPLQAQTNATNLLTDSMGRLQDSMGRLIDTIKEQGGNLVAPPMTVWPDELSYGDVNGGF